MRHLWDNRERERETEREKEREREREREKEAERERVNDLKPINWENHCTNKKKFSTNREGQTAVHLLEATLIQ